MDQRTHRELNEFQIRNLKIITHLIQEDAVTDDVIEYLHQSELDYFSLLQKYRLLEEKVNVDEKTNLLKHKDQYLTEIIKTASRFYYGIKDTDYPISLIRFDIDDFSLFNNRYGHDVGDRVLVQVAGAIRNSSRPTDYAIRFGGEEFDVILPSTSLDGTIIYVDKVFERFHNICVDHDGEKLSVTVSAGISHMHYRFNKNKKVEDSDVKKRYLDLQKKADNALYEAKFLGKNRYCIYSGKKKAEYVRMREAYTAGGSRVS